MMSRVDNPGLVLHCFCKLEKVIRSGTVLLDKVLEAWRDRPLGKIIYLYPEARDEKVRMGLVE